MAACRHGGPDRPLFLLSGIMEDGSLLTDGPRIAGGEISEAVEAFAGRVFHFLPRTPIVVDDAGAIAYCPAIIRAGKDHPLKVDRLQPLWDLDRLPILPVVVEKCAPRAHGPPFLRCG